MKDIDELQSEIALWSADNFGDDPERKLALAKHLAEEADELLCAVIDTNFASVTIPPKTDKKVLEVKMQIADCLILIIDLLAKFGFSMNDAFEAVEKKMEINKTRQWEGPDDDGLYHHK